MIFLYLFNVKTIATVIVITTIAITVIIAMSVRSSPPISELQKAASAHTYLFIVYLLFLGGTVILTLLVWQAAKKYQDVIKRDSDAKITTAEAVSETAKVEAAKANEMASEANERAKQMELRVEEVKKENIKLQLKLEEERNARFEIERRLAPRFLTSKEENIIIDAVRPYAGHPITITILGDAEAGPYGQQIVNALGKAGWRINLHLVGLMSPPPYGIICSVSPTPDPAIKTLIAILQKIIPAVTVNRSANLSEDHISMIVGLKPPQ